MKRLLAFLIIPLLFIFACEDEDKDKEVTLRYEIGGICDQITTSNEEIINELKDMGYSNGTCDKSEAIAKCHYSDSYADAEGYAYQYSTDMFSISEFKDLCENDLGGFYDLLSEELETTNGGTDFDSAVLIETGTTVNGEFSTLSYVHYFKINLESGKTYKFYTSGGADTKGYLYDNGENLLDDDDDDGINFNFSITYTTSIDGIYYIVVEDYDEGEDNGSYALLVEEL